MHSPNDVFEKQCKCFLRHLPVQKARKKNTKQNKSRNVEQLLLSPLPLRAPSHPFNPLLPNHLRLPSLLLLATLQRQRNSDRVAKCMHAK